MTKFKFNKKVKVMICVFLIAIFGMKLHLLHKKHVEYKRIKEPIQSKKIKTYKKFTINKKKEIIFNESDLSEYHNPLLRLKHKQDYNIQEIIKKQHKEYDEKQAELRRQEELRKQEEERQRQEQISKQQELQKSKQNKQVNNTEINRGGEDNQQGQEINIIASFYSFSEDENGGNSGLTASGKQLSIGMCASNNFPFGTKISTSQFGVLTVEDTGNPSYLYKVDSNTYRIDILVNSKSEASKLGIQHIKGYIIK